MTEHKWPLYVTGSVVSLTYSYHKFHMYIFPHGSTWCFLSILTLDLVLDFSCHFVQPDTNLLGADWISCNHWAMNSLWRGFIDEQQILQPTQCYSIQNDTILFSNFMSSFPISVSECISAPVLRKNTPAVLLMQIK